MKIAGIVLLVVGVLAAAVLPLVGLDFPFVGNIGTTLGLSFGLPLVLTGGLLLFFGLGADKRRQEAQRLLQVGRRATVRVMGVTPTGLIINNNPQVQLVVDVYPEDGTAPFRVAKTATVSYVAIPRVGDVVPALYDPANPNAVLFGADLPAATGAAPVIAAPPPSAWSPQPGAH